MKRFKLLLFIILFAVNFTEKVFSFGPITHYHINKETSNLGDIFNTYGMIPDAFILSGDKKKQWEEIIHSPNPRKDGELIDLVGTEYYFVDKPNFAFILYKISPSSIEENISLGIGGHISADWVAHSHWPIPFEENLFLKALQYIIHAGSELAYDYYTFLTRGFIVPEVEIRKHFIWKGFVNWKLIEKHEQEGRTGIYDPILDLRDRDFAIEEVNEKATGAPPEWIYSRIRKFVLIFATYQAAFTFVKVRYFLESEAFKIVMQEEFKAEEILNEAKQAVNYWLSTIAPCNTQCCARGIPEDYRPKDAPKAKVADVKKLTNTEQQEVEITHPEELFIEFWEGIATKAEAQGILQVTERQLTDEFGRSYTKIKAEVTNPDALLPLIEEQINNFINTPRTLFQVRYGKWLKHFFIEGELDPDLRLDFDPPIVEILSPHDLEYVNANPLVVSGKAIDKNFLSYKLEYGEGENPQVFNLICEGTNPVEEGTLCIWNTANLSGLYTLKLYAVDKNDNENEVRIKIYIGNPNFISSFGKKGKNNGEFNQPSFIASDKFGNIYITDTMNHRVQKFDKDGNYILSFGEKSKGAPSERLGEFNEPLGITIDSEENIYVADSLNHRIQKFTKDGNFISSFGKKGENDGEFNQPAGIAIDSEGNIYVLDSLNHRIQKFDKDGNSIMQFGKKGNFAGEFNQPKGVAIDSKNNIYIADSMNNRVQIFEKNGNFVKILIENLRQPQGIFIDSKDNIYITDTMNNKILKLDRFGNKLFEFGNSQFKQPGGIYVEKEDKIMYIVDTHNHRVQKFSLKWEPSLKENGGRNIPRQFTIQQSLTDEELKILQVYTYPNPYRGNKGKGKNTSNGITFRYKAGGNIQKVVVEIYNIKGKLIDKFSDSTIDGEATYSFADRLANGVYIYRISISDGRKTVSKTGKIVVLK